MTAAGVIALAALAVVVASLAYLHLALTGLSPVRNAVSQYGISRLRTGYRVATIAFAASAVALAVGIERAVSHAGRVMPVLVLLGVFAAARAVISWFPMDEPGAPRTPTGRTHGLLAIAAFCSVALAAGRLGSTLAGGGERWHDLSQTSTVLSWAMALFLVGMWLRRSIPALAARFGLIERGFYVMAIAWFAVFAIACIA
jgi:hypothetical protein